MSAADDQAAPRGRDLLARRLVMLGGTMADTTVSEFPAERRSARRYDDHGRRTTAASVTPTQTRKLASHYRVRLSEKVVPLLFGSAIVGILWIGWLNRESGGLTPESGVGYWLGIAGGGLMLLLLLYPLRKRIRALRAIGGVVFWFRAHMILGVVGPVLVIFHTNFKLGSINSNVALFAMLIVAVSGVIGRYLYGKVHVGLYGRKAEVKEILADADAFKRAVGADLPIADRVVEQLSAFAQLGTAPPGSALTGFLLLPVVSVRANVIRWRLVADARQVIASEGRRLGWSRKVRRQRLARVTELVTLNIAAVRKAAAFAFYERLFRLWHVFHLPLFFLLVIAAAIHIFAAHFF
jgi:hypothetical protein